MKKINQTSTPEDYIETGRREAIRARNDLLKKFDFDKAARVLRACRWRFADSTQSPTAEELRIGAKKILESTINSGSGSTGGWGPLEVSVTHYSSPTVVSIRLSLRPVETSGVYFDGRALLERKMKRDLRKQSPRKVGK